jgi:hypothetical protein
MTSKVRWTPLAGLQAAKNVTAGSGLEFKVSAFCIAIRLMHRRAAWGVQWGAGRPRAASPVSRPLLKQP